MTGDHFAALADPTRRAIFEMLAVGGPRSVGELANDLPVSRPAVSQHLKVLVRTGMVGVAADGTRRIYRTDPAGLAALRSWIDQHWDGVLDHFGRAARMEAAMTTTSGIAPVTKTRTVPLDITRAFDLFTHRIAAWWPTGTHSISADTGDGDAGRIVDIRFDGRVGGRVTEVLADGTEHSWADVLAWDPPNRVVLSWHPNPSPVAASRLEVRFSAVDGGTRVDLRHDGWEELGDVAADRRAGYDTGWEPVLDRFVDSAAQPANQ
ncbi:MAG TPA: metalloregulator ArsR/SmtB family transcription factor [Euzebyales bacterium]